MQNTGNTAKKQTHIQNFFRSTAETAKKSTLMNKKSKVKIYNNHTQRAATSTPGKANEIISCYMERGRPVGSAVGGRCS